MAKRKRIPFQALENDWATVAAACGVSTNALTDGLIAGLQAALIGTESPLKDAVDRLVERKELDQKWKVLCRELDELIADEDRQIKRKSSLEPLAIDHSRWNDLLDELEDVAFRMI